MSVCADSRPSCWTTQSGRMWQSGTHTSRTATMWHRRYEHVRLGAKTVCLSQSNRARQAHRDVVIWNVDDEAKPILLTLQVPTQPRPCRSSRQRFTIACTAGPPPRTICERRCMVSSEPQLLRVVCCRCLPPRVGPACGEIAVAVVRGRTRSRCLQGKRCCGCALRVSGRTVTTVVPPPPPGRVLPRKSTSCGIRARQ